MRTNRSKPVVLSDRRSKAVVEDVSLENSVIAPKKSRVDASECLGEDVAATNCDADECVNVSESGDGDLTGRPYSSNDGDRSTCGFDSNVVSESANDLSCQPECHDSNAQYHDSSVETVSVDTSRAVSVSLAAEDCWWNKVDSHTWLQGLQSYLLLHSAVDSELSQMPVAVLPPNNATTCTVIANTASHHPATLPSAAERHSLFTEHQYARPVLTPITGYRVSTHGVLSAVPIYYFPVVNYNVCRPSLAASAIGSQQTYIGGRPSTMAAVDLVSFMHNYCLPPSSIPQSSISSTVVQTDQPAVSSQNALASKWPGGVVISQANNASDEQSILAVLERTENNCLSNWPMKVESSNSDLTGGFSNSSLCFTPQSLSSCSSAEGWNDDASELLHSSATVAISSEESCVSINTSSLFSDLTIPGWFGKGLSIKRSKRRSSRQS